MLSRQGGGAFRSNCLDGVELACNSFLPGLALSVALTSAEQKAQEKKKREPTSARESVDALLLEILELLPDTVSGGFDGSMEGCAALLEAGNPKKSLEIPKGSSSDGASVTTTDGDFLDQAPFSKIFLRADLRWVCLIWRIPKAFSETQMLCGISRAMVITPALLFAVALCCCRMYPAILQGEADSTPCLSYLPEAQVIVPGIAANPQSYHVVPAMRMVLDFVTHFGVLAGFSYFVLLRDKGGADFRRSVLCFLPAGG